MNPRGCIRGKRYCDAVYHNRRGVRSVRVSARRLQRDARPDALRVVLVGTGIRGVSGSEGVHRRHRIDPLLNQQEVKSMLPSCDHKRYSCAEVGCIGDPGALSQGRLWEMTKSSDREDAKLADEELVRRGVLGWCPACRSRCFVLDGHCRGCAGKSVARLIG